MDEQVRTELCDLIATSGPRICDTPRVLSLLLAERCPTAPEHVRDLVLALECGCVRTLLLSMEPVDEQALVQELVTASGLSFQRARWAVAAWDQALKENLAAAERPLTRDWSTWNQLDVSRETAGGIGQRAIWHLGIVGLAGACGGTVLGFVLLLRGDQSFSVTWREALEGLAPGMQVLALLTQGILGGLAGGVLGWVFGAQSWTSDGLGGTTFGRLVLSALGAFSGAAIGVVNSLGPFGLVGVMPGTLVGAGLGAFLGLLAAERMARFRI